MIGRTMASKREGTTMAQFGPAVALGCVWCLQTHADGLLLCPECEAIACRYRRENGLSVRKAQEVGCEPDD